MTAGLKILLAITAGTDGRAWADLSAAEIDAPLDLWLRVF